VGKADSSWAIDRDERQRLQETVEGHGFSRAENMPSGKGLYPPPTAAEAVSEEFDFAGLKPGASTGLYGASEGAPLRKACKSEVFCGL
jgi:hypothetical protein